MRSLLSGTVLCTHTGCIVCTLLWRDTRQLFHGTFKQRCFYADTGFLVEEDTDICGGEHACAEGQYCAQWTTNPNFGITSFDNILWACNTIFMCISLEGWAQVMYFAQDATSSWAWVLFVLMILFGAFILINLMLAVIMTKFREAEESQKDISRKRRADEQRFARHLARQSASVRRRELHKRSLKQLSHHKKKVSVRAAPCCLLPACLLATCTLCGFSGVAAALCVLL